MDHSYHFYVALCHLQLNEFSIAENILAKEIEKELKQRSEEWLHPLDLFYLGIALYEQKKYQKAIETFDKSLRLYPNFSDAKYYKARSLFAIRQNDQALAMLQEAKADAAKGYTFNEDNAIYERYPYQVNWRLIK